MKAVVCQNADLEVVERPEPTPGRGHVRLTVSHCGICGSDLHARHGLDDWADLAKMAGYDRLGRSDQPVVFGHEFCGEVAEYGPGCKGDLPTGTPVVALPLIRGESGIDTIGLSVHAPGAYAEQLLTQESMVLAVPGRWVGGGEWRILVGGSGDPLRARAHLARWVKGMLVRGGAAVWGGSRRSSARSVVFSVRAALRGPVSGRRSQDVVGVTASRGRGQGREGSWGGTRSTDTRVSVGGEFVGERRGGGGGVGGGEGSGLERRREGTE